MLTNRSLRPVSLAVAASVLWLTGCSEPPAPAKAPRSVKAMQVVEPSSLVEGTFPGRASAGQQVNLSFRVGGPLVELPVSVSDSVEEGALVAQIDPTDYQSVVASLEGQLQSAQAAANRAEADYRRIQKTFEEDPGATTEMALDRARQLRDSTSSSVRGLQATVDGARDQLSYTSLTAPFAGEVVETYVENFETVIPKQPILRIVNPSRIEFTINVAENQIVYAPYVTGASVVFDALPDVRVTAAIKDISREASQATRTYPVTLTMEQPEGVEILPGMAGQAVIEAELPESSTRVGIQVPATALFTEDNPDETYVWVITPDSNTLERRTVTTGVISDYGVLILSGLSTGEQIVVAGPTLLSAGEEVRALENASESAD